MYGAIEFGDLGSERKGLGTWVSQASNPKTSNSYGFFWGGFPIRRSTVHGGSRRGTPGFGEPSLRLMVEGSP